MSCIWLPVLFAGTSAPTSPQPPPTTAPAVSDEVMDRLRPAMTPGLSSSAPERSSMEEWFEVTNDKCNVVIDEP